MPSVNLLDGKAKQFDDGLYAALDQAYYRGLNEHLVSHVALVRRLYNQVDKKGPAAAFLAAGLELADVRVDGADQAEKALWLNKFQADELRLQAHRFLHLEQHPGQLFPLSSLLSTAILEGGFGRTLRSGQSASS